MSSYNPTDLQGQEASREEEKTRKRLAAEGAEQDLKWLMSSKRGRRIVSRLLEQAGVFRLSFDSNAMRMAFNEGNRSYGNWLFDQIRNTCFELIPVMIKEFNDGGSDGNGHKSN